MHNEDLIIVVNRSNDVNNMKKNKGLRILGKIVIILRLKEQIYYNLIFLVNIQSFKKLFN